MINFFTNTHNISAAIAALRLRELDPAITVKDYIGLPKVDQEGNPISEVWMHFEIDTLLDYNTVDEIIQTPIGTEDLWNEIRGRRNALLTACDWTQIPDAPLTIEEKQAWADYRQALRNIPQDFATPEAVVFPEKPA